MFRVLCSLPVAGRLGSLWMRDSCHGYWATEGYLRPNCYSHVGCSRWGQPGSGFSVKAPAVCVIIVRLFVCGGVIALQFGRNLEFGCQPVLAPPRWRVGARV